MSSSTTASKSRTSVACDSTLSQGFPPETTFTSNNKASVKAGVSTETIGSLFSNITIEDVLMHTWQGDRVLTVSMDSSVKSALELMASAKIHSAPVIAEDHTTAGFVSIHDLLRYVFVKGSDMLLPAHQPSSWEEEVIKDHELFECPVVDVLNAGCSFKRRYVALSLHDTLAKAISLFAQDVAFKIVIVSVDGHLTHILSQSDVIRYLHEHLWGRLQGKDLTAFEQMLNKTCEEAAVISAPVILVEEATPVIGALKLLDKIDVGALAVVRHNNEMVGNFSARDITGLTLANITELTKPVGQYLEEYSPSSTMVIACKKEDSVRLALQMLVTTKVYRVWVMDKATPTGVITISNILKYFYLLSQA